MASLPEGVKAEDVDMIMRSTPSLVHSIVATFRCKDNCETLATVDHAFDIVRFADSFSQLPNWSQVCIRRSDSQIADPFGCSSVGYVNFTKQYEHWIRPKETFDEDGEKVQLDMN